MLISKFVMKCKLKVHSTTPKRELGMGTPSKDYVKISSWSSK
jgi:hypothetical protein